MVTFSGNVLVHHPPCLPQHLCTWHRALSPTYVAQPFSSGTKVNFYTRTKFAELAGPDQPLLCCPLHLRDDPEDVRVGPAGLLRQPLQPVRLLRGEHLPPRAHPHPRGRHAPSWALRAPMRQITQDLQGYQVSASSSRGDITLNFRTRWKNTYWGCKNLGIFEEFW